MSKSVTVSGLQSGISAADRTGRDGRFSALPLSMEVPGDCCCRIANQVTQTPLTISYREVPGPRVHHSWGTAAPCGPRQPGETLRTQTTEKKSSPPSHGPLGTKLHGTAGVVSEDEATIKESRRQMKGTGCWLFSLSHLPPAMPEVSPVPGLSVRSSGHL